MKKKKKNVGHKPSLGRHHKENIGRYSFHGQHQRTTSSPIGGMTKSETQQIILGWSDFALRVLKLLVELLKVSLFRSQLNPNLGLR